MKCDNINYLSYNLSNAGQVEEEKYDNGGTY